MPSSEIRTHDPRAVEVRRYATQTECPMWLEAGLPVIRLWEVQRRFFAMKVASRPKGKYYGNLDIAITQSSFYKSAVNIQWPAAGRLARVQFTVSKFTIVLGHNPFPNETTNRITTPCRLLKLLRQCIRRYPPYLRPPPSSKWGRIMSGCHFICLANVNEIF